MVQLIEVKAGELQTPKTIRQKENLAIIQEGLQRGEYPFWLGQKMKRIETDETPRTYIKILEKVMLEAQSKLASSRVFGEYMSFCVFYIKNISELSEETADKIRDQTLARCWSISKNKKDIVIPIMSNIITSAHFSRMVAPYTIFPIDVELRFGLMTGEYLIQNMINVSGLERWLKNRGWVTQLVDFPEKISFDQELPFLPVLQVFIQGNPKGVEIGLDTICCAALEFWMPESFESIIKAIILNSPSNSFSSVCFLNSGEYAWD